MDLTNVTASVVGLQQLLKARTLGHISWPNETERVSPLRLLSYGKSIYSNWGLKDIVLQSKVLQGRSLFSRKTSHLRGARLESQGKVLPPRPSLLKKRDPDSFRFAIRTE